MHYSPIFEEQRADMGNRPAPSWPPQRSMTDLKHQTRHKACMMNVMRHLERGLHNSTLMTGRSPPDRTRDAHRPGHKDQPGARASAVPSAD